MSPHAVSSPNTIPLSVVMPTHGRVDLYQESLASLERQSLQSFELIVTDDSPSWEDRRAIQEAAMAYADRTGRIARYLHSEPRLGQARNTNQGLHHARGTFIRILHSDDLLAPRALEAELALLTNPDLNLELLYHLVEAFKTAPAFEAQPVLTLVQPTLFFRSCLHSGTPLPSATVFHRRLLEEIGGMREDFDFLCDWEFFARLLATQHRRHRFLGRLSPGFVGWRVHGDSTTGRLWDRHFLEHEQFMTELEQSPELGEALIGDQGTRDGFFATAVRYRYRRLGEDISGMPIRRMLASLPRIARCALSRRSLRARLKPAPWTPRGAKIYPRLVAPFPAPSSPASTPQPAPAPTPAPAPQPPPTHPRAGLGLALSARTAHAIVARARRFVRRAGHTSSLPAPGPGPELVLIGTRVQVSPALDHTWPETGTVRIFSEYNNTINFWQLRRLFNAASEVTIAQINGNTFAEPVLHHSLKFLGLGSRMEVSVVDNQHLTSFGFKALLDRLFPNQFRWVDQTARSQREHVLRYERTSLPHATYSAHHTGWTFGMLTTGTRLENVERFIDSVGAHCDEPYEILLVSPVPLDRLAARPHVRVLHFAERDDLGWITRKKNLVAAEARYSDICVCHDRFLLDADFTADMADGGYAYGIAAPRVRLEDGRRGLDWGVVSSQNQVWSSGGLLDYRAYSRYAYAPGGATLIRKAFWRDFPWNENLFWNEHEDVELSRRIQRAGGIISLAPATLVALEDRWVDANPRIPYCDQNEVLYGQPVGEQRIHFLGKERAA